ncbi:TPA: helix-turn-helix domain-containing protein [Clostridium botulinum]|nr:DNA-binding protein [Clostridium botulinum]NFB61543.1 DNA-binding protein [Clostridium botulinum]HCL4448284.1 helix-turn-helix domain-containing protein [Clostridium botulinum]HCL4459393.1 helix-turn-helix domain-containing protein [Clostridium botulinum]HCL4463143.1 helix-turn-helix domain-containing protein [Clostridium botulinum]
MEKRKTILIDPTEAMKFLGVGRNRMYEDLLKRKDFPAFKMGCKYFVNRELLQEWANKQCLIK